MWTQKRLGSKYRINNDCMLLMFRMYVIDGVRFGEMLEETFF